MSQNTEVLAALRQAFPQLFSTRDEEGVAVDRLDLEKIRVLAGEGNFRDTYGLRWENKPEKFEADSVGKLPTLARIEGQSIQNSPTKPTHVLIEGDNYHALQVLAYTHERSVDVIYIDPPYNTGNKDFKYNDRFVDREDGYRHSKWLSFMAKRLKLAKTLLKDTGVIFISIDENERAALELLCAEELQFRMLGEIIWDKRSQKGGTAAISTSHEHILVFANPGFSGFNEVPKPNADALHAAAKNLVKQHKNDLEAAQKEFNAWLRQNSIPAAEAAYNHIEVQNGKVRLYQGTSLDWPQANSNGYRFSILHPETKKACRLPDKGLRCAESTFWEWDAAGRIIYGDDETTQPRKKLYLDENMTEKVRSIFVHSKGGVSDLRELNCGLDEKFPYPKPLGLLKHLLGLLPKDVVVLDFFAGSGTTAHACMQLNAEDGGSRQCILATNDEGEFKDEAGTVLPGGICTHVTYPRLKTVIEGYSTPKGKMVTGLGENLEFFRTAFHSNPRTKDQTLAFAKACVPLLELKAGCFQMMEETASWRLYSASDKYLFILLDDMAADSARERLTQLDAPIEAFVFAYDADDDTVAVLNTLPNVDAQAVPKPILDLYHRLQVQA